MSTRNGVKRIGASLRSFAQQDLDHRLYEVVVVISEGDSNITAAIRGVLDDYPSLTIRIVRTNTALAWNLGIASARYAYQVRVGDDAMVSPHFLSGMLGKAKLGTIVCCPIVDVGPDGVSMPNQDGTIYEQVRNFRGRTVDPQYIPSVFNQDAAKVVATDLAQFQVFDQNASSSMDMLHWATLAARYSLSITPVAQEDGVIYRRSIQDAPNSTDYSQNFTSDQVRLISGLREVAEYDSPFARALTQNVVERLGRYVQDFPERRQDVLLELLGADCPDLPYHVMTDAPARTLATLYAFPPTNDSSALVAARRLWGRGELFDVISNDLSGRKDLDPGSTRIVQGLQRNQHVTSSTGAPSRWPAIRNYVNEGISKAEEWQDEYGRYEILYSRAKLLGGLFLAALVKIRNPEIYWIAEFSDPLLLDIEGNMMNVRLPVDDLQIEYSTAISQLGLPLPKNDRLYEWAEHLVYSFADEVLFTNEAQRDYMIGYTEYPELRERAEERARVEPHPTLPKEFYRIEHPDYPMDPRLVHVGYFGRFYVSRGLTEIVTALQSLDPHIRDRIQLHVFVPDPGEVAAEVAEAGLAGVIVANPYVPYLQFLSLTTKFDCLLVTDARTSDSHGINPYLPSKYADYRGSGQPIWAVVEPGSPLSNLDFAYRSNLSDAAGATRVLVDLVRSKGAERQSGLSGSNPLAT